MKANTDTNDIIQNGLKDIIFNSKDINSKETALELLLLSNGAKSESYLVENYRIPGNIYIETVRCMKEDNKIKAIKEIRNGLRIGLKEAKELVEKISFVEEIPMTNGYRKQ